MAAFFLPERPGRRMVSLGAAVGKCYNPGWLAATAGRTRGAFVRLVQGGVLI
jgi:hypothetical protein